MFSGARKRGRPASAAGYEALYPMRFAPYVPHPVGFGLSRVGRLGVATARIGSLLAVAAAVHQVVNLRALREPPAQPPPVDEAVSVLVPARDEASRITPTIRSLLAQTGVADLEILVLDDQSSDGTAATVRAVAAGDPRLAVLAGSPPPPGWLGKPHACAQLAAAARGRVLVFVDADVVLAPHAVAAAVDMLRGAGLQLLCPWPRQLADGLGPRLVQPLLAWSWMVMLPLRRAEASPRPRWWPPTGSSWWSTPRRSSRRAGSRACPGRCSTTSRWAEP